MTSTPVKPTESAPSAATTVVMSPEEEEARSSELIAKLLQADAYGIAGGGLFSASPYLPHHGSVGLHGADDDDDSIHGSGGRQSLGGVIADEDYDPALKPKGQRRGRPPKNKTDGDSANSTPSKPRKRVKAETPTQAASNSALSIGVDGSVPMDTSGLLMSPMQDSPNAADDGRLRGTWSKDEETRFTEALEIYGRDWQKISEHVKTRDAGTCRSKAQKHFIKLYREGLPLPAKVKESGEGYTLSGKPLDPYSAAARPYLRLPEPAEGATNPDGTPIKVEKVKKERKKRASTTPADDLGEEEHAEEEEEEEEDPSSDKY